MHSGAKTKAVCFVIVYLFFVGLLNYPYIARIYNSYIQGKCITAYEKDIETADNISMAKKEARLYNQSLNTGVSNIKSAFQQDETAEDAYLSLLSINKDHTMGYLRIPRISLELPIYHGTSEKVLQKGIGHLEGSSMPIGGKGTHACLSAHRGLPNKRMFTNLDLLEKGDIFFLTVLDETLAYQICNICTVLPDEIAPLAIKEEQDLVTLITCTPYGINTHRLYVTGTRIPYQPAQEHEVLPPENWWALNWYLPVTAALLMMMFIILCNYFKSQKIQKNQPEPLEFNEK